MTGGTSPVTLAPDGAQAPGGLELQLLQRLGQQAALLAPAGLQAVHPQLAGSRGISCRRYETLFTVCIAVVVTLAMSWVGLMVINSLLVLPAAASRNLARNLRQYHLLSILSALGCSLLGLMTAYLLGCSAGATIALYLAAYFAVSFALRRRAG
mgnify:CR=1 FL=1